MNKYLFLALLFAMSLGLGQTRLAAQTLEDPVAIPIHVNANFMFYDFYELDTTYPDYFQFTFQGVDSYSGAGDGTKASAVYVSNTDTGSTFSARIEPDKTYSLTVEANNTMTATVSVSAPSGYTVIMDGGDYPIANVSDGTVVHTVRVVSTRQMAVARSGTASSLTTDHVYWQVALGALQDGDSAGWLSISDMGYGTDLSSLFTPAALQCFCLSPETFIYPDPTTHNVRQVLSNDVCVDVQTTSSTSYTLNFYNASAIVGSSPPYTFSAGPYVSYLISEGSDANHISITSTTYSGSTVVRTAVTSTGRTGSSWPYAWSLQDWHTSGVSAPVQAAVINALSTTSGTPETTAVEDASSTIAINASKQFTQYDWGSELTSKTLGSTTASQDQTAYQYYTGVGVDFSAHDFVQSISHNGHWIGYEYQDSDGSYAGDGIVSKMHEQYLNSTTTVPSDLSSDTSGKVTSYTYGPDAFGVYDEKTSIQTQCGGTTIGYSTIGYTGEDDSIILNGLTEVIAARTDWANSSGSSTLSSEVRYYSEDVWDEFYRNRPCSVTRSDMTRDSYAYQRGSWDGTTFTLSGQYLNSSQLLITSGLGTGNCSRVLVIHGTTQTTNTTPSGSSSNTQITTIGSSTPYYNIVPVYLVTNESTEDITIRDQYAHVVYTETDVWTGSTWQTVQSVKYTYDPSSNELLTQTASNGAIVTNTYNGEQLNTQQDATGITSTYAYDAAGRVNQVTKSPASLAALATTMSYDAAGHVLQEIVGSSITKNATYDDAGRVTQTVDPNTGTTSYAYSPSTWTSSLTLPNGGTRIDGTNPDGTPLNETGTGVVARYFTYLINSDGSLTTTVFYNTSSDARHESVQTDVLGRTVATTKPTFGAGATYTVQNIYDTTYGWLNETTRSDGTNSLAPILYQYDSMAQCYRQGLDIDGTGSLSLGGADRITDSFQDIEQVGSDWWATKKTITYPSASSSTPFTTSMVQDRLTSLGSGGEQADEIVTDSYGTATETKTVVSTLANTVTQTTSNPAMISTSSVVAIAGLTVSQTDFNSLSTTIGYDSLWRPVTQTDSRGNAITTAYKSGTTQVFQTTDATGTILSAYTYDSAGRVSSEQNANTKYTQIGYDTLDHVINEWGDIPYPVSYGYDAYGARTSMSTYQGVSSAVGGGWNGSSWPGGTATSTTYWAYDGSTGLLNKKTDPASQAVNFTYNSFGQTSLRTLARGTTSTYAYDPKTAELTGITYSDSTPSVSYTYNRSGQLSQVTDATGTRTFNYNNSSYPMQMTSETLGSFYGSLCLTSLYNTSTYYGGTYGPYTPGFIKGMMIGYELGSSEGDSSILYRNWDYSNHGQFMGVHSQNSSSSPRDFVYTYLSSSNLISGYTGSSTFTVSRSYESQRDLLSSIQSQSSSTVVTQFDYVHDPIYQISSVVQSGTAFSSYGSTNGATFRKMTYDDRGELSSDIGYLGGTVSDTSNPLPDRNFGYGYDGIGDRTSSNYTGNSGLQENYTVNNLNQYTGRENLTVPVSGSIADNSGANVVLSTSSSYGLAGRTGGLWSGEVLPPEVSGTAVNASGPAVFNLTMDAGWPGGGTGAQAGDNLLGTTSLSLTVAPQNQTFAYDADGNLSSDNMWSYTYDAENRLIGMTTSTAASAAGVPVTTIAFAYDYLGRRVQKSVAVTGASTVVDNFVYAGSNVIADYRNLGTGGAFQLQRTFTWGLDVTGSLTSAGGVGALLELTNFTYSGGSLSGTTDYFPTYDGNGNVASLINGTTGAIAAAYEYSSFGESVRIQVIDAAVTDNPMRFSTKFTDAETGLIYYGNRFYNPHFGRFINRDPTEENGGINLYGFCDNDGINRCDYLGNSWLSKLWDHTILKIGQQAAINWDHQGRQYAEMAAAIVAAYFGGEFVDNLLYTSTPSSLAFDGTIISTPGGLLGGSVASGAISTGVASTVAGIAGGAAGGLISGVSLGAMSGENFGQALNSGLEGAEFGAISGGITAGFGQLNSDFANYTQVKPFTSFNQFTNDLPAIGIHGIEGSVTNELENKNTSSGFWSGVFGSVGAGLNMQNIGKQFDAYAIGIFGVGVAGGLSSMNKHGSGFMNGFWSAEATAATSYLGSLEDNMNEFDRDLLGVAQKGFAAGAVSRFGRKTFAAGLFPGVAGEALSDGLAFMEGNPETSSQPSANNPATAASNAFKLLQPKATKRGVTIPLDSLNGGSWANGANLEQLY